MISQRQLFLLHNAQVSNSPLMLEIEKANGMYLYDIAGKRYLDLIAGISVSNLGHCNTDVVEAINTQSYLYAHLMVYGEFVLSPQVQLAGLLASHLPSSLNNIYFTNSGTEATEGAMKLAKRFTARRQFVSFKNSYHGSTQGALSIMGNEYFKNAFRPLLPDTLQLEYGNENQLHFISDKTAAVIIEPVQAEAGVKFFGEKYLQLVRNKCNETGALMILDEIQTGMGRTGSFFAFQQFGFVPDILLTGKALGAGLPLAAFISSHNIMQSLTDKPVLGHITTFGGNAICCAAALAGLKVLLKSSLIKEVRDKEKLFIQLLKHKLIKEFRSVGLLMAIEFENEIICRQVIKNCMDDGIITDWFLFAPNCLRIAPPLIISNDEIKFACAVIINALNKL